MKRSGAFKGYLCAIISAVIFGCMPLMAKFIYADGVTPLTLVFLRNLLSLPLLAALAYAEKKTFSIPICAFPSLGVIAAMGCCATPALLFSSYQFISSGTATVFHFIYPAAVVIANVLVLRQRISKGNLIAVALCVLGICCFYTPGQALDWKGSFCALASGVTYAVYVLLLSGFRYKNVSGFLFSFYVSLISSVLMFLLCAISGQLVLPVSPVVWGLCVLFAMAVNGAAVVLFQQGTFLIGGERTSILSTLEPMTSILIGSFVLGEAIGLRSALGSVLVIAASLLIAVMDMRRMRKQG